MNLTVEAIGTMDDDDMVFITTDDAKKYMKILNHRHKEKVKESTRRPYIDQLKGISPELLNLLENML